VSFLLLNLKDGGNRQSSKSTVLKETGKGPWNDHSGLHHRTRAPSTTPELRQWGSSMAELATENPVQAQLGLQHDMGQLYCASSISWGKNPPLLVKEGNQSFIMSPFARGYLLHLFAILATLYGII